MELSEIFDLIRPNPNVYLYNGRSLTSLHEFLMGYEFGRSSAGMKDSIFGELHDFTMWLKKELAFPTGTRGWCTMILMRTKSEAEAFDLFFELFRRFKRECGKGEPGCGSQSA